MLLLPRERILNYGLDARARYITEAPGTLMLRNRRLYCRALRLLARFSPVAQRFMAETNESLLLFGSPVRRDLSIGLWRREGLVVNKLRSEEFYGGFIDN